MKTSNFKIWLVRFIFCVAVITTYKFLDDFSGILRMASFLLSILSPFIFGGIFSFFLFPPCKKLEQRFLRSNHKLLADKARGLSTLLVVFAFIAIIVTLLWVLLPIIYQNILVFISAIPGYINDAYNLIQQKFGDISWLDSLLNNIKNFFNLQNLIAGSNISKYLNSITSIFMTVFNLLIGFIIAIYLLLERTKIKSTFTRISKLILKTEHIDYISNLIARICKVIFSFVYGQMLDAFLIGVIVAVTLLIFQIPNAIVLGFIYFLFALIPYFGPFIGVASIGLLTFLSGGFEKCIIALIICLVLQQVDGNFMYPRVIGNMVGIRPLYVILGVTLFGGLFGFFGLFLGPPLMSIIIELSEEFISSKERKKELKKASLNQNKNL